MTQPPTVAELQAQIDVCRSDFFAARRALVARIVPCSPTGSASEVADHLLAGSAEYDPTYVMKHVSASPADLGIDPITDMKALRPLLEQATALDRQFESLVVWREELLGRTGPERVYAHMGREFTFDANTQRIMYLDAPGRSLEAPLEHVPNRTPPQVAKARSQRRDRDR